MVCSKCEKKLSKLAAPDPFNVTSTSEGKRKIGQNTLLTMKGRGVGSSSSSSTKGLAKGKRFSPYAVKKCKDCNSNVSQNNAQYCHTCAFKKGLCSICGKAVIDTSSFTMSTK
ncbi:hypothetical protein M408DRAFT_325621 [Serendipita vermifera MAFF 305830]|uniref:Cysteine-rich PDZ-binding protein n=1 Tax=Serendipita vermifera MAFF 305830 TaxID=933852 RepID=A0A0C3BBC9_SERVB|nr:hypothetical protein M408DRAFT_325621 [Serendipita vermifera MAFF 305830]